MNQTDRIIQALYLAKSDNRERMLSDLVLNILYNTKEALNTDSIIGMINDYFHLKPIKYEVKTSLESLVENNEINYNQNLYSLTEDSKQKLYLSIVKGKSESSKREETFHKIVKDIFDGDVSESEISKIWLVFNEYLIECFMVFGRRAIKIFLPYEIDELAEDDKILEDSYKKLDNEKLTKIFKNLIIEYPERLNEVELRYLSQLASRAEKFYSLGVEKNDYEKIKNLNIKDLVVLIDTNILYSILNLHKHPEKNAITEIIRIATEKQIDLRIVYLPRTYNELLKAKNYLDRLIPKENFKISQIKALLNSDKLDAFAREYYENKLKNSDFPHPSERITYGTDFLKQNNIIIYNNRFPHLEENEKYVNEKVAEYLDFQRYYNNLCQEKGYEFYLNKDDKKIEHDVLLRESIKELKSKFSDENELRFICITLDRSLVHFDNHTLRNESQYKSKIINPNFISPSIFLKKIRPFIPISTNNYRKAFISSLTAPGFEKENAEETILVQKSMSYFKSLGIEDEEIILNCIKRELFLEDFSKHEKDKTSEEFIKTEISKEIDRLKSEKEDLEKNVEKIATEKEKIVEISTKKVQNLNSEVNLLSTQKNKTESENSILSRKIETLENQRIKENLFHKDLDRWKTEKNHYLLKEWDDLPKYKWYIFYFSIACLLVFYAMYYIYTIFHEDEIFKLLLAYATTIGATIFLSFFIRDKIVTSFKYNFRTEKYRKSKVKEFEKEFEKKNKEPKLIDYLE